MESANEPPVLVETAAGENPDLIFQVHTLLPGRIPFATLVVIFLSVALDLASYKGQTGIYAWFYSDSVGIWIYHRWWGLIGSVFLHGGFLHLLFNCYWIWLFGRLLEHELGVLRYIVLLLGTAWFGNVLQLACTGEQGIGLSGVAYGYFGYLLVSRARHPDFARMANGRNIVLLVGWMVLCFPLTYLDAMNVANFAHLGGFIAGGVIGLASYPGKWRLSARVGSFVLLALSFVPLCWAPWLGDWSIVKASRAMLHGDDEAALVALAEVRRIRPDYEWALQSEVYLRMKRKEYLLARDLLAGAKNHALTAGTLNNISWLLATHPDEKVRDGARAVEMGQEACSLDGWLNATYLDTLAAAQAEAGHFDEAVELMLRVLKTPGDKGALYQSHLDAFRAHKPWREAPAF